MMEVSLLDMVFTTIGVLVTMTILSCLCCFCMRYSDQKMKKYIVETAKRKGIKVDLDKLDHKDYHCQCSQAEANENCTIMVPDVGIIL